MLPRIAAPLTARPATRADAAEILGVVAASEAALDGTSEIHEADIRQMFDLARDDAVVLVEDRVAASVVATAWLIELRAEVFVHPAHRGRGIGTALRGWTEARARTDGAPMVRQTVTDADTAAHAMFAAHGYRRAHTSWILGIDLPDEPPTVPVVEGIEIVPFDPARARETFDVIEDAFLEFRPGARQEYDHWVAYVLHHDAFDPATSRIALDGDAIVGATMCYLYAGVDEGWIQQVATRATHRHRGIARALLRSSFAAFHERGLRLAGLSTDSRTGALSLYERVGMHVRRSYTSWIKDLAAVEAGPPTGA